MSGFNSFYYECYCAEYAKSSRSECKVCGKPIEQDTLRIGHVIYFDEEHTHINKKWMHLKCVQLSDKFKNLKVHDIEGVEELNKSDLNQIKDALKIPLGDAKTKVKHLPKVTVREYKKVDKFADQKTLTKKQWNEYESNKEKFNKKKVNELKDILTKNNASNSGAKDALVNRCALFKVIGSQPNCPSCGGQNLRFYLADGEYYCPGYLDDTDWANCKTWFKFDEVTRNEWVD